MADDNGNGSAGRFLRIEAKLDTLIQQSNGFQLDTVQRVTRLEMAAIESRARIDAAMASTISARTQKWVVIGIVLAFIGQTGGIIVNAFRIGNIGP